MSTYLINLWKKHFINSGINEALIKEYMSYVTLMLKKGFPPVFEFSHLCQLLGREKSYLSSVVNCPEAHYRSFRIPKRKGGFRTICAPYLALLECQQWIYKNILKKVKIHKTAHGFKPKKSILTNAKVHLSAQNLLKLDLKDFFPSITKERIIKLFCRIGYPPNVSCYLASICCYDDALPQGAATSPYLSNIIAKPMDARLYGLAQSFNLKYTRYADDLSFSGDRISIKTVEIIKEIIYEEGFIVNDEKTFLCRSEGRKIVTGISITGNEPKVPKKYKRKLRQELFYVLKYGFVSHARRKRVRTLYHLESLYGKLIFWKWVEPQNTFVIKVLPQLSELIRKK